MNNIKSIREHLIILIINFFGIFGLDLLRVSEQIVNKSNHKFFNKFLSIDSIFIVDRTKIKKIIKERFRFKINNTNLIDVLSDLYLSRVMGTRFPSFLVLSSILEDEINNNEFLSIEDWFLLSKFLSKLGYFTKAEYIERRIFERLTSVDFSSSVYTVFQRIKSTLYNNFLEIEDYLMNIGLYNHMKRYYFIDIFINKIVDKVSNDSFLILGPLRDELNIVNLKAFNLLIVKPSQMEVDIILTELNNDKTKYFYSYKSKYNILASHKNFFNVIEHNIGNSDKNTMLINGIINFYLINGFPQHLQRVLLHQILEMGNFNFIIEGFDFYTSNKQTSIRYISPMKLLSNTSKYEIHSLIWGHGWHDLLSNFRFISFLHNKNCITVNSESLSSILNENPSEYAIRIENLYRF